MAPYYDQPLRKLLGALSPTIAWLTDIGSIEVNGVPAEHLDAVKQLERIGVVHKRNNRLYELQKIRLRKLMDSMGMETLDPILAQPAAVPVVSEAVITDASISPAPAVISAPAAVIPAAVAPAPLAASVIAPQAEPIVQPVVVDNSGLN